MKQGWEIKILGEVCDFQNGFAFKSNTYKSKGLPILRITNIQNDELEANDIVFFDSNDYSEDFKRYQVHNGDLVIAMSGATTGKLGINNTDTVFYLNQRVGKFLPKNTLLKYYLYFFLSTKVEENLRISAGAAQPNLSTDQIRNFKIPLPPLPEQKRIVKVLNEVFEKITKAKKNADKNLQNSRELFDSYLHSVFANPGDGWEERKLGEVCEFEGGSQPPKDDFIYKESEGYIRLIQIRDYKTNEKKVYIPIKKAKRFCDESDIMIGRYGPPVFQILRGIKGAYNVALMKAIPKKEKITKEFIYFYLQHRGIQQYIINLSQRAVGQTGITKEDLEAYPIYFPSIDKQCKITDSINSLSVSTKKLETIYRQRLVDLVELKKSILQKAFNGKLTGVCS